jgi:hypothetical protein
METSHMLRTSITDQRSSTNLQVSIAMQQHLLQQSLRATVPFPPLLWYGHGKHVTYSQ